MIYLDHAATRPMRPAALETMKEALEMTWGNASPTYPIAQEARARLDMARTDLADSIGAPWRDIFFTSGGTESDNWALIGGARANKEQGRHLIISQIEHHASLHTCDYLKSAGFDVTMLPVDSFGRVDPEELESVLQDRPDTSLVSVMMVNNEVGTIQDIQRLARIARSHGALFHTDAVQAYGKILIDVKVLQVDLLSVSAHKIGGPKGMGFLYIRNGVQIDALIHGGQQESGRRAGTENVPAAMSFAAAAKEAISNMEAEGEKERELQTYFYDRIMEAFTPDQVQWNGAPIGPMRVSSNLSFSFPGCDTQTLLVNLDLEGICASGGSACTTGAIDPSHVIMALTHDRERSQGVVRFTLGPDNSREEIDQVVEKLHKIVTRVSRKEPADH